MVYPNTWALPPADFNALVDFVRRNGFIKCVFSLVACSTRCLLMLVCCGSGLVGELRSVRRFQELQSRKLPQEELKALVNKQGALWFYQFLCVCRALLIAVHLPGAQG